MSIISQKSNERKDFLLEHESFLSIKLTKLELSQMRSTLWEIAWKLAHQQNVLAGNGWTYISTITVLFICHSWEH